MDFKDIIKQLGERFLKSKDLVKTEEATKHSLIMPFIQALGYDVFNPLEVVPEFVADLGIKIGEKVDYAILKDGHPILLIECKHWSTDLNPHNSQLFRYYHTTKSKFGLLTNGFEYRFYADLVEPNKMDEKPFFVFNITEPKDNHIEELKKFHKTYYNFDTIVSSASELKYVGELKALIHNELQNPSPEFVKYFGKQVYSGVITQKVLEQFTGLVNKSFNFYITDIITDRLKSALQKENVKSEESTTEPASTGELSTKDSKINTTVEEMEAFQIVRSIIRRVLSADRVHFRDAQNYFSIIADDNNRRTICRIYLNSASKKYIGIFEDGKTEVKIEIKGLDDIFNYDEKLIASAEKFKELK